VLVDFGFTLYEALKIASVHPNIFVSELDLAGMVEVGKQADLVFLDSTSLEDINNTRMKNRAMISDAWGDFGISK
jgi:imidazolonepropionase-like amidohydrolase